MPSSKTSPLIERMAEYVAAPMFPCVGARSAFNKKRVRFGVYDALTDATNVEAVCGALLAFSREFPDPGSDPVSFCALFVKPVATEAQFSRLMWEQLQAMHVHDRETFEWDPTVSADPAEPDFSFSVAGRAFFVVGLHPQASRLARRSPVPCLVFNFHNQFEALRANGKYAGMQKVIRQREIALQGNINPVLARFGEQSEARQYSGMAVDQAWRCPFHAMAGAREAG